MAEFLGKRLLQEVEEEGLDEIFYKLRCRRTAHPHCFGWRELDGLVQTVRNEQLNTARDEDRPPVVELSSLEPGGGKTHLIYHLVARAVLPPTAGGQDACVVIVDTDCKFSIARLCTQLRLQIERSQQQNLSPDDWVHAASKHVHIFRPQSTASAVATLDSLSDYLFSSERHSSFDRQVGFIALDSASTLYWHDRLEQDKAKIINDSSGALGGDASQPPSSYLQLGRSLRAACNLLKCSAIITSWYFNQAHSMSTLAGNSVSLRPSLPPPWNNMPTLRLVVRRMPVRSFPSGISAEQAARESHDREQAVEESRFECVVNEWGLDDRVLQRLRSTAKSGFEFKITKEGLREDHSIDANE